MAFVVARYSQDPVNVLRWILLMLVAALVVTVYLTIFPRCFVAAASHVLSALSSAYRLKEAAAMRAEHSLIQTAASLVAV